jgi:tRNA(adenine34) deaminase
LTDEQQESLMREALREAALGMSEGEAPIGCVLALGSGSELRVVARGHNRVNALGRKNAHAEIIAFENAGSQNGEPPALPLDAKEVILVSTLEPCVMCLGAAMESGVTQVLFGLEAPADNGTQRVKPPESPESSAPEIKGGILPAESRALFEKWLQGKEGTEQAKFVEQLLALTD